MVNFTWEKTGGIGVSNSTNGNNFVVEGNRPQQNLFLLNGVEFTGAAENNMQPGGTSQQLLGVDAVREFNVLRDSYGAEYGKRPGGAGADRDPVRHAISCTDRVYEFLRNNALDARNFFDGDSASRVSAQSIRRLARRADPERTNLRVRQLRRASVSTCTRPAWIWCPTTTRATAICPASWSPRAQSLSRLGLVFVGVSPLINAWPAPSPGAPDFGGIAEAFNNPLQTIRDDFGTVRLDHNFSSKDFAQRRLHHR